MNSEEFQGRSSEMRIKNIWLASEDIMDAGDVEVEIEKVFLHKGADFEGGRKQDVFALKFKGKQKQMILNATNRKRLVAIFGTTKTSDWIGKKVMLYVDKEVKKPGAPNEKTCGLRIRV